MNTVSLSPEIRYGQTLASYARSFRHIGCEIDSNPLAIVNYHHLPAIDFLINDRDSTTLDRTIYLEAFGYGDPGVLLACPGPSLSGLMMRELGTPEQMNAFYDLLRAKRLRTFFALTEPKKGSDANNIEARLTKTMHHDQSYLLNGTKCFFGNGAVGDTGIVFARISSGPIGVRAIWLTPELLDQDSIEKITLPAFALRGAQIAGMCFQNVKIPHDNVLGHHKSACENGLLSIIKVFNRLRTGVGAIAIGQAQAVYDLCVQSTTKTTKCFSSTLINMQLELDIARTMLRNAAKKIDANPLDSESVFVAKVYSTSVAEKIISTCINLFSFEQLIENEWLIKTYRDSFCWEYMEGTTHILKKQIMRSKSWIQ